jgi:AraC-like DNA-binding protein
MVKVSLGWSFPDLYVPKREVKQPSTTQSVIRILHALVVFPDATLERVAAELSVHPRTLNRRLEADGTSFRALVNETRFSVSRQLLSGTKMEIADIALALGYADPSGFTHAFQRWSGMAPIEWRKQEGVFLTLLLQESTTSTSLHLKLTCTMSGVGQSRRFDDVRVTSAYPPRAAL